MNEAQEKVKLPSILLMVTAGVGIVADCLNIGWNIIGMISGPGRAVANLPKDQQATVAGLGALGGIIGILVCVLCMIGGAVIIFGAMKMKNLQSWGLSLTAAILALISPP